MADAAIVGEKHFRQHWAPITIKTISNISALLGKGQALHVCGRLTTGLKTAGMLDAEETRIDGAHCYGDAILKYADNETPALIGNACVKRTAEKSRDGRTVNIWRLKCTQKTP
jgi:hypothetical protein